mmetsp:Transcript_5609/g.16663  ORF Transcript_5609/g.16663 Transcript_5609/m.16663 type:complete len:332 (+) Transcript_5609:787-1782(+)
MGSTTRPTLCRILGRCRASSTAQCWRRLKQSTQKKVRRESTTCISQKASRQSSSLAIGRECACTMKRCALPTGGKRSAWGPRGPFAAEVRTVSQMEIPVRLAILRTSVCTSCVVAEGPTLFSASHDRIAGRHMPRSRWSGGGAPALAATDTGAPPPAPPREPSTGTTPMDVGRLMAARGRIGSAAPTVRSPSSPWESSPEVRWEDRQRRELRTCQWSADAAESERGRAVVAPSPGCGPQTARANQLPFLRRGLTSSPCESVDRWLAPEVRAPAVDTGWAPRAAACRAPTVSTGATTALRAASFSLALCTAYSSLILATTRRDSGGRRSTQR